VYEAKAGFVSHEQRTTNHEKRPTTNDPRTTAFIAFKANVHAGSRVFSLGKLTATREGEKFNTSSPRSGEKAGMRGGLQCGGTAVLDSNNEQQATNHGL
jgi:hypothetical protein